MKARTSVIPFLAILQGRQELKPLEFLKPTYLGVTAFVLGFWWFHPTPDLPRFSSSSQSPIARFDRLL